MPAHAPGLLDGLTAEQRELVLGAMQRRRFASGAVVIAEGDMLHELLIVDSGTADVFMADRRGLEHKVGRVGPGTSLGEMSLFARQPAVATVRARSDLEVLVLRDADFEPLATRFPVLYRNLGAILSQRLALTNRRAIEETQGRVTLVRDWGAPPDLVWALACSVAWHVAGRMLLVREGTFAESFAAVESERDRREPGHAHLMITDTLTRQQTRSLTGRTEELFLSNEHILIHLPGGEEGAPPATRTIHLAGPGTSPPAAPDELVLRAWTDRAATRGSVVDVPRLGPVDLAALERGALPTGTPAGDALGRVARSLAGLEVGLALGAGSIRGYAHFGVLDVLARAGIPVDYVAGTSIGALVGGIHARGMDTTAGAELLDAIGAAMVRATLPRYSLLSSRALRKVAYAAAGEERIEDLPIPLAVVAADLVSHRQVVFRSGLLWLALVTATSIPGIYPPVRIGPHILVDGGVLNPVPTDVVAGMGAGVIVAVNLGGTPQAQVEAMAEEVTGPIPPLVSTILRSIDIMQATVRSEAPHVPTIVITPEFGQLPPGKLRNFREGRRFIALGEQAAESALPRLEAAMPWLKRRS